jgi:dihydrofolate synthase/folylpolyglutamate synthase
VPASAARDAPLDRIELPLLGDHQKMNAAVALATLRVLASQLPVSPAAIRDGLMRLHWPGRLQLVTRPSGQRLLLDGAHNPGGAEILAQALRQYFADARPALVLEFCRTRTGRKCAASWPRWRAASSWCPCITSGRPTPMLLAGVCAEANPRTQVLELPGLAAALAEAAGDEFVVIAGSLYLIGEAMELLHLSAAPEQNERKLNEWGPPRDPGQNKSAGTTRGASTGWRAGSR